MKRVLILAYDFPPYVSVGGLRPHSWYKYFHEFGLYPIVVTRQWENKHKNYLDYISPGYSDEVIIEEEDKGTIIRTPYKPNAANRLLLKYGKRKFGLLSKIISAYYELIQWFTLRGPKSPLFYAANDYLKNNQVDILIATGDPFILFRYASILSKKYNIPWIADYRDLWSQDFSNVSPFALIGLTSFFERKVVRSSRVILTVNETFKYNLSKLFISKEIIIIKNGYDPEAIIKVRGIPQKKDQLSIAYLGSISENNTPKKFFSGFSKFIARHPDSNIIINFYGINNPEYIKWLCTHVYPSIKKHIRIHDKQPNESLLKQAASNNILLLFSNHGSTGTKIYDYIALNRCILFCFKSDYIDEKIRNKKSNAKFKYLLNYSEQENIIQSTSSGIMVRNSEELVTILEELNFSFIKNKEIVSNTILNEDFSRKNQAEILCIKLKEIVPNKFKENNKVLILAYDFPPYISVGGQRPFYWYKHLNKSGLFPVVITRQWENKYKNYLDYIAPGYSKSVSYTAEENGAIMRVPYFPNLANRIMLKHGDTKLKFLRQIVSLYYELAQWFLPVGPKYNIYKYANTYLKENSVNAIIATAEPFILHKYGVKLGRKFDVPFIADYRDLWSHNQEKKNIVYYKWIRFLERRNLLSTTSIVVVSEFLKSKVSELTRNPISIISNGFDGSTMENVKHIPQNSDILTISIVGTIYKWNPLKQFLNVLRDVIVIEKISLQLKIYGANCEGEIIELIESQFKDISMNIIIVAKMSNEELYKELKKSNVLLLFNYYYYMGTKIYDYLGIQRKILLCFKNDVEAMELKKKYYPIYDYSTYNDHLQEDLIFETNSGIVVNNQSDLYSILLGLYNEFKINRCIQCDSKGIEKYSRKNQTENLAISINETIRNYNLYSLKVGE